MRDFFLVNIKGRVSAIEGVRDGSNGKFFRFDVAVNRGAGEKKRSDFIQCIAGAADVDFLADKLAVGQEILVEGELSTRQVKVRESNEDHEGMMRTILAVQVKNTILGAQSRTSAEAADLEPEAPSSEAPPAEELDQQAQKDRANKIVSDVKAAKDVRAAAKEALKSINQEKLHEGLKVRLRDRLEMLAA